MTILSMLFAMLSLYQEIFRPKGCKRDFCIDIYFIFRGSVVHRRVVQKGELRTKPTHSRHGKKPRHAFCDVTR